MYCTHAPRILFPQYAIKIEKGVRILKVEYRALTALQHVPEVCRLHDQGSHADKAFLVLEVGFSNRQHACNTHTADATHHMHAVLRLTSTPPRSCWAATWQNTVAQPARIQQVALHCQM